MVLYDRLSYFKPKALEARGKSEILKKNSTTLKKGRELQKLSANNILNNHFKSNYYKMFILNEFLVVDILCTNR